MASSRMIPPELAMIIIKFAFASSTAFPANIEENWHRVTLLTLSHAIHNELTEYTYRTVVLWSVDETRNFAAMVVRLQHVGSLVHNLWIGGPDFKHSDLCLKGGNETPKDCCIAQILAATPHLQRLYITVDDMGHRPCHRPCVFQCHIPESVKHLTLPDGMFSMMMFGRDRCGVPGPLLPPHLRSLRIKGHSVPDYILAGGLAVNSLKVTLERHESCVSSSVNPSKLFDFPAFVIMRIWEPENYCQFPIEVVFSPVAWDRLSDYRNALETQNRAPIHCIMQKLDEDSQLDMWLSQKL